MDELKAQDIRNLVAPMLVRPLAETAWEQFAAYIRLLTRWNARINLTAVRDPRTLAALHIAECIRASQRIPEGVDTVLDFGSGAGLPGIPMQIACPELHVTLAESQKKKAAFLQEAVRELGLPHTSVYSGRVEDLPPAQSFNLVAMRAVDRKDQALSVAERRIGALGFCMVLISQAQVNIVKDAFSNMQWEMESMPGTKQRILLLGSKNASSKNTE